MDDTRPLPVELTQEEAEQVSRELAGETFPRPYPLRPRVRVELVEDDQGGGE